MAVTAAGSENRDDGIGMASQKPNGPGGGGGGEGVTLWNMSSCTTA
jgi:hypothetical protein